MQHKVGIKVLSDTQLENVLPTYENLLDKVEVCRRVAKTELESIKKRHYQYNFMYDNVFSILGQRGTGKTSVAFTLRDKLQNDAEAKGDVILPIIIPEVIPESCTVLGWLLAIVKEEIEKLEEKIQKLSQADVANSDWKNCGLPFSLRGEGSLSARVDKMIQLSYAGNYNPHNEESYHKAVSNSVMQADHYYKFAKDIANVWDEWVGSIQKYHQLKNNNDNVCPLLYFIFDDVDLTPEKIDEILSVIIKYLSHPNVIVIVTADESLFLEAIENRLDRNIGRLPSDWRKYLKSNTRNDIAILFDDEDDSEEIEKSPQEDITSRTARMYLGKVLPTSTRYYLNTFITGKQKQLFLVEDNLYLGDSIKEQIDKLIGTQDISNFMASKNGIRSFYLCFMGYTSRQIGNIYIAIKELADGLNKIIKDKKKSNKESKIYYYIKYFLRVAINANHKLAYVIGEVDQFLDNVFLFEYNQWKLYIDYMYLNDFVKKKLKDITMQEKVELALAMYSLMAFVEKILLLLEKLVPGGITDRKKIHTLPNMTEYLQEEVFEGRYVFREDMSEDEFIDHYANILDSMSSIVMLDKQFNRKFDMQYFYGMRDLQYGEEINEEKILQISQTDKQWLTEMIGRMFLVYGNAYLFDEKDMEKCLLFSSKEYLKVFQEALYGETNENIQDCFLEIEMHKFESDSENIKVNDIEYSDDEWENDFIALYNKIKNRYFSETRPNISITALYDVFRNEMKQYDKLWEKFYIQEMSEISESENIFYNIKEIKNVITLYKRKVKNQIDLLNFGVSLFDPSYVLKSLESISRNLPVFSREIGDIRKEISTILSNILNLSKTNNIHEIKEVPITVKMYNEIYAYLTKILRWGTQNNEGFLEDKTELRNTIERILESLNLVLPVDDGCELQAVIRTFMKIKVFEKLQQEYIGITIKERYEKGNSFSSKKLEYVTTENGEEATYYYQFFKQACDILEKSDDEELKSIIRNSYMDKRRQYVNSLIIGVAHE